MKKSRRAVVAFFALGIVLWGVSLSVADEKTAVVDLKLPKPAYTGTPKEIKGTTAEKPSDKKREPWKAPAGVKNLSLKKPVTSSDDSPIIGELAMVTDGDKEAANGSFVELGPGLQWVQIDLGKSSEIHGILLFHNHADPRVYRDVVVQISDDAKFASGVKTVFNNDQDNSSKLGAGTDREYFETFEGKLIEVKPAVKGRYVRCYSKGNTSEDQNHYTEVEVYGIE